jgi:hypothetical protein
VATIALGSPRRTRPEPPRKRVPAARPARGAGSAARAARAQRKRREREQRGQQQLRV